MSILDLYTANPRTRWFAEARYGMFIHWGLYALLGRGEWVMNRERIPVTEYEGLAKRFDASDYRPTEWAELAKAAGMRYGVLTSKHHEGFCLWNSRVCNFNSVNSAAGRDLVGEYVEAFRNAGLKVGLYYSLGDWHNPDWAAGFRGDVRARDRFMENTHASVRELLTQYGTIDILWYDLPQCYTATEWRSVDLNAMARSLQPNILINNRAWTSEDFGTPEQHVEACAPGRLWEACMTLNGHWGYCPSDRGYKSATSIAQTLARVASGGGNLLLNVGPDGHGKIPEEASAVLRQAGKWLERNGEAVYSTHRHQLSFQLFGQTTVRENTLYCHLGNYFGQEFTVGGLLPKVLRASVLGTGQELFPERQATRTIIRGLPESAPDPVLTVVKLELDGPPAQDISEVIGGADIMPVYPN
ncbi:MAG: alpha-L-fucosidase [Polyangiaceae bacterium]|nr:alpha-L-fucosidase [Polyangiaceae bacterium]